MARTDSTSAFIKRHRGGLREMSFVSAAYQTAGRGRLGRSWESKPGENLLFSLFTESPSAVGNYRLMSLASAAALVRALEKRVGSLMIKWPNDVLCGSCKLCGVLLEGLDMDGRMDALIVGVGVNVNQTEFKGKDYKIRPTSLKLESGKTYRIGEIRRDVYAEFRRIADEIASGNFSFTEEARARDYLRGKEVFAEIDGERRKVYVRGINPDGSLGITLDGEDRDISSGEITFHI